MKERFIEAGEVVNTHGVRGEVKIIPWTDSAEFLAAIRTLYIDGRAVKVRAARVHKGTVLAALEGVEDVNAAMRLKGRRVFIDRADAKLPEGGYFIQDIIGAEVVTEDGESIGALAEVIDAPASMIYVVRGDRERLRPAVPEFILKTDADAGLITVRLIEGM